MNIRKEYDMKKETVLKGMVTVSYIAMIAVNALANILPLNGQNTGEISDSYPNLFAPAGFTFSVWGVIYLLLAGFVVYQWKRTSSFSMHAQERILEQLRMPFTITSLANIAWLFSWHYELIALSTVFMIILLVTLIYMTQLMRKQKFNVAQNLFMRIPFNVYFGWITIATVANITILLVKWDWSGFGLTDTFWAITILLVACGIAAGVILQSKDVSYGAVILWALFGILSKHLSSNGWDRAYPLVIYTVYALLAGMSALIVYTSVKNVQLKNSIRR